MCGWIGALGWCPDRHELKRAGDTLASRGPDGSGERLISEGPMLAGLGHRRLAIIDPSDAGAQPMHDGDRGVTVVYNGEIYNSPQLRRDLQAKGVKFHSTSDTEVLLLGWAEWGDRVLDRIEGIFSFALIDERRGRALLARDRLGVKPLYWAKVKGGVVAASAPRAILALVPDLGAELDRVALAQYLTLLWIPHPRTPWRHIHKLPPGHALAVEPGQVRQWRYWKPPQPGDSPIDTVALRQALESATAGQLLSDVPVGLLLSGGLDSTVLLENMVRHYQGSELRAVTAGYNADSQRFEIAPDDVQYARLAAARHPDVDLREIEIGLDAEKDVDALSYHFDDPVADPAAISLYRLVRDCGAKVLLSGVGGEELFAGYPRHVRLPLARRAARLPGVLRDGISAAAPLLFGARPGLLYSTRRNAQKMARALGDRPPPHYWRMMSQLTAAEVEALLPGTAIEAFGELDAQSARLADTDLARALAFDREQFLPNLNLAYVDKASMAAGVEVRVPLLDEAVVDLAYRANSDTFVEGIVTKVPLRTSCRGLVPDAIVDRPKSGFGAPARAWWQGSAGAGLRERVDALADTGLVSRRPARRIVASAASGRQDAALAAWALVCLEAWHRAHGETRTA
jgi:asparagine synthase (glutamine-hydrolysing)